MNEYRFTVWDENFKTDISVQASNIIIAKEDAKMQFAEKFNSKIEDVHIKILDVENHVDEIIRFIYEGSNSISDI